MYQELKDWFESNQQNIPKAIQVLDRDYSPESSNYAFRIFKDLETLAEQNKGLRFEANSPEGNFTGSYYSNHKNTSKSGFSAHINKATVGITWDIVNKFWLDLPIQ